MNNSGSPSDGTHTRKPARGGNGWETKFGEHLSFFAAFLREPTTVGAVCPSSRALARAMVEGFSLDRADTVVEIGPGTGAFTALIRERLGRQTTFLAMELNDTHAHGLRRRFPDLHVYHDSAERLTECLARHGKKQTDYVISGLPWVNLSATVRERIMEAIAASLAPQGTFTTFAYIHACWLPAGRQFRSTLQERFAQVSTSPIVWRNVPPAFVYRCSGVKAPGQRK
jgi:phospholipid N-methyltransferase